MVSRPSVTSMDIEPRLATVETQIGSVTGQLRELANDVRDLSSTLRDQGVRVEGEIQKLLVGLTNAAAPRRTDWQALLTGVGLILAIGGAALSPVYLRLSDVQTAVHDNAKSVVQVAKALTDHSKLKLHPVGETRIDALEHSVISTFDRIEKDKEKDHLILHQDLTREIAPLKEMIQGLHANILEGVREDQQELRSWRHPHKEQKE